MGDKVHTRWEPYTNNKAYLKLNEDLLKNEINQINYTSATFGLRDDLYDFWFVEMEKNGNCSVFDSQKNIYISNKHSQNKDPALDRCLERLNQSEEYNYLREMFLTEYENCMNTVENSLSLKNLFNTVCLDIISIRRLLIEYELCCNGNKTDIRSTICSLKNFNKEFVAYNLTTLIDYAVKKAFTIDPSITTSVNTIVLSNSSVNSKLGFSVDFCLVLLFVNFFFCSIYC